MLNCSTLYIVDCGAYYLFNVNNHWNFPHGWPVCFEIMSHQQSIPFAHPRCSTQVYADALLVPLSILYHTHFQCYSRQTTQVFSHVYPSHSTLICASGTLLATCQLVKGLLPLLLLFSSHNNKFPHMQCNLSMVIFLPMGMPLLTHYLLAVLYLSTNNMPHPVGCSPSKCASPDEHLTKPFWCTLMLAHTSYNVFLLTDYLGTSPECLFESCTIHEPIDGHFQFYQWLLHYYHLRIFPYNQLSPTRLLQNLRSSKALFKNLENEVRVKNTSL